MLREEIDEMLDLGETILDSYLIQVMAIDEENNSYYDDYYYDFPDICDPDDFY
jgi:hypothetical protein